jgi:hypothetical protein
MSRGKPGRKSPGDRPPPLPGVVRIRWRQVAEWQIDNAILIWFQDEEDVVSPHTLAVAARDVLIAVCRDAKIPISSLASKIEEQVPSFKDGIKDPQNFFKHGYHKQPFSDVSSFTPAMTEAFLIDGISMYEKLFRAVTTPMIIFAIRVSLIHPETPPLTAFKFPDQEPIDSTEREKIRGVTRREFFQFALSLVAKRKSP